MGGGKVAFCALACGSLLLLPPLLLKKDGPAPSAAAPVRHVVDTRVAFRISPPTTAALAPAPAPATPVTAAPAPVATPTTAPYVAPPTTLPVRALAHSKSGEATWYGTGTGTGYCASPYLPRGTWAVVTNLANGKSIRCMVSDAQVGSPSNRIVDLAPGDFAALAGSTAAGVVQVTVSW